MWATRTRSDLPRDARRRERERGVRPDPAELGSPPSRAAAASPPRYRVSCEARPVRSADVYRVLHSELRPAAQSLGLRKKGSGMLRYVRGDEALTVWAQCDHGPWDPVTGKLLTFELELYTMVDGRPIRLPDRHRFYHFLDDLERKRVEQMNDAVRAKLAPVPASAPRDLVAFYGSHLRQTEGPYAPGLDIWLRYLDEPDVRSWGAFLAARLPRFVAQLERIAADQS